MLNLLLVALAIGAFAFARYDKHRVSARFARVLAEKARTPADAARMKEELAKLDLTRHELQRELEGRMRLVAGLKSEEFYLSIDTRAQRCRFYYGDAVLREDVVVIGDLRTINANGRSWTFIPLKGAFPIEAKAIGYNWRVPEWLDPARPAVPSGLGKYVLVLPNGYVIHTPPPPTSPLHGAKPGSYMVPEEMLAAIWPRIQKGMPVYIY